MAHLRRRLLRAVGILLALVAAAAAGWLAAGHPKRPAPVIAAAPSPQFVRVGPLDVRVPASWQLRVSPSGSAAEAAHGVAYTADPGKPSWDWLAGGGINDPSLVPAAVRRVLASHPGSPLPARLAGRPAWAYPDLRMRGGGHLALVLAPVASGVLLVGCEGPRRPAPQCGADVLAISGPPAVAPTADLALRMRGGPVLRWLWHARLAGARALHRARTPAAQAAAAGRLAAAHGSAATSLTALAPRRGAGADLIRALHASTSAYARLQRAAGRASPAAYRSARRQATRADRRLRRALAPLS